MKTVISISEARKQLPGIIQKLRQSPDTVYQVTVHGEVVAEIKTSPRVKPGEAAKQLLALRKRTATKSNSKKYPVSEHIKEHLYVAEDQS
jgi:antitoxin (DNA-binding transcriptional repressor) of toxin-antitoxin stability system